MGLIRLYLALSVLCFHIGVNKGGFPFISAGTAVYSFFLLSGFYISLGLNEKYTTPGSNSSFYLSRLIRLWPAYAVSLMLMAYAGVLQQAFHATLDLPPAMAFFAMLSNLTMFGLDLWMHISVIDGRVVFSEWSIDPHHNGVAYLLNLPAWSLAAELAFYAMAPFVVRSFKRSAVFLGIGLVYHFAAQSTADAFSIPLNVNKHYPYYMLFFGLGMAGYWMTRLYPIDGKTAKYYAVLLAAVAIALHADPLAIGYVALAITAPFLFRLTANSRTDKFMGDLAYPLYILHVPVGAVVRSKIADPSPAIYFAAAIVAAVLVLLLVERPIDKLKARMMTKRRTHNHNACATSKARFGQTPTTE